MSYFRIGNFKITEDNLKFMVTREYKVKRGKNKGHVSHFNIGVFDTIWEAVQAIDYHTTSVQTKKRVREVRDALAEIKRSIRKTVRPWKVISKKTKKIKEDMDSFSAFPTKLKSDKQATETVEVRPEQKEELVKVPSEKPVSTRDMIRKEQQPVVRKKKKSNRKPVSTKISVTEPPKPAVKPKKKVEPKGTRPLNIVKAITVKDVRNFINSTWVEYPETRKDKQLLISLRVKAGLDRYKVKNLKTGKETSFRRVRDALKFLNK